MADILLDIRIQAPCSEVFAMITTPAGLDRWWTKQSSGHLKLGSPYELWFGPEYDWRAEVSRLHPPSDFELTMTRSDEDWLGTRIGFRLEERGQATWMNFYHAGWPSTNEHFRISCHCWALYLRILRRALELGEDVPYEQRLE